MSTGPKFVHYKIFTILEVNSIHSLMIGTAVCLWHINIFYYKGVLWCVFIFCKFAVPLIVIVAFECLFGNKKIQQGPHKKRDQYQAETQAAKP